MAGRIDCAGRADQIMRPTGKVGAKELGAQSPASSHLPAPVYGQLGLFPMDEWPNEEGGEGEGDGVASGGSICGAFAAIVRLGWVTANASLVGAVTGVRSDLRGAGNVS